EVGGVVAGQHRDGGGDLPHVGGAAEGLLGGEIVEQLGRGRLLQELVAGQRRRDRVDPHTVVGSLDRRGAGERHDARLGRRVVGLCPLRAPAQHGGVVADYAGVRDVAEVAQRGTGGAGGPVQGDVQDAVPVLVAHVHEVAFAAQSGVVDEHVDPAARVGGAGDERVLVGGGLPVAGDRFELLLRELRGERVT